MQEWKKAEFHGLKSNGLGFGLKENKAGIYCMFDHECGLFLV